MGHHPSHPLTPLHSMICLFHEVRVFALCGLSSVHHGCYPTLCQEPGECDMAGEEVLFSAPEADLIGERKGVLNMNCLNPHRELRWNLLPDKVGSGDFNCPQGGCYAHLPGGAQWIPGGRQTPYPGGICSPAGPRHR